MADNSVFLYKFNDVSENCLCTASTHKRDNSGFPCLGHQSILHNLLVTNDLLLTLDSGSSAILILLNLNAAFDTTYLRSPKAGGCF